MRFDVESKHAIVFSNSNSYFILTRQGLQPMFKLGSRNTDCKCRTGKATRHGLETGMILRNHTYLKVYKCWRILPILKIPTIK